MKHMKTLVVPATAREVVDYVTCDLCGAEIEKNSNYNVCETEVRYKAGNSYPEGGSGTEMSVDMCVKCFHEKLIPWLRSQGVEPRTTEWEW